VVRSPLRRHRYWSRRALRLS